MIEKSYLWTLGHFSNYLKIKVGKAWNLLNMRRISSWASGRTSIKFKWNQKVFSWDQKQSENRCSKRCDARVRSATVSNLREPITAVFAAIAFLQWTTTVPGWTIVSVYKTWRPFCFSISTRRLVVYTQWCERLLQLYCVSLTTRSALPITTQLNWEWALQSFAWWRFLYFLRALCSSIK